MMLNLHPEFFSEKVFTETEKNIIRGQSTKVYACIKTDCFFAQAISNKLGLPPVIPLASVDNGFCISVNNAALSSNITKGMGIDQAKRFCPSIILVDVNTFKNVDHIFKPNPDAFEKFKPLLNLIRDKAALQYYRGEWDRVCNNFRKWCSLIEKVEFEEIFLDISYEVYDFYKKGNYSIEWRGVLLGGEIIAPETEKEIMLMIGSQMIERVCKDIKATIKYTCHNGISHNKMLAQAACDQSKPEVQSIILERYTIQALKPLQIAYLRGLKIQVVELLENKRVNKTIEDLQKLDLQVLETLLKDEKLAKWIHERIRGFDDEPFEENDLRNKSIMLSKYFTPVKNMQDLERSIQNAVHELSSKIESFYDLHKMVPKVLGVKYYDNILESHRVKTIPLDLTKRKENFPKTISEKTLEVLQLGADVIFPCNNVGLVAKNFTKNELDRYEFDLVTYTKVKRQQSMKEQERQAKELVDESTMDTTRISEDLLNESFTNTNTSMDKFDPSQFQKCPTCQILIHQASFEDHNDFHVAEDLDKELNPNKKKYKRFFSQETMNLKGEDEKETDSAKPELKKVKKETQPKGRKKKIEEHKVTLDHFFIKK